MLIRLFRSNQPGVLIGLLVLVPLLFLRHLLVPTDPAVAAMPLQEILQALFMAAPWTKAAFLLVTICTISVQLIGVMGEAELVERRNHLPALLFPILLATLAAPGSLGPALYGMPFVLWAMRRTWTITSGGGALSALFDAGLLLGIAAQFYMPFAFLVVVVWASVSVVRPFSWREYLVPFIGTLLVFYLAWGALTLGGVGEWQPLRTIALPAPFSPMKNDLFQAILSVMFLAFLAISLFQFARHYNRGVVREQNLRSAFLALVATLGVVIGLVLALNEWYPPVLLATPLALLFTFALVGTRRAWLNEVAGLALLAMAIWKQFG